MRANNDLFRIAFVLQNECVFAKVTNIFYMLFAGWEVRIVKHCDRGLENAARRTAGRGQYFQGRGHSFSLYGPTLKTANDLFIFSCGKLAYKQVCLRNFVIELA